LKIVDEAAEKAGLTMAEVALRWVSHHSQLKREHGDSVIIGASSVKHLEQNLLDLEKGPLPDEVVKSLDEAWDVVKGGVYKYYH
jgi:aflatoxin B1 aldehyde reductase